MNTAILKEFAPSVRNRLIEAVGRKLDFVLTEQLPEYRTTFARQVRELRDLARQDRSGLLERVAYTWFNRLVALRFLDARGWHPFYAKVIMPASPGELLPELLAQTRSGHLPAELAALTKPQRLEQLLAGEIPSEDAQGEVYRELVLAACRYYHKLLPDVFERLDDATELLLPDDLLTTQSVVQGFRTSISDDDCATVEVIGWLYQFYISEKKDAVMRRKTAVPSEDIPAVTQLFTPHWIVRYLVENSLGRLWLLNHPSSGLRAQMPYYIEGEAETEFLRIGGPEEIRLIDPACGSGHMLTYAFDLLYAIYEEAGYPAGDIIGKILGKNLVGVDICPRAAQLAQMALVFKAREKARRWFQTGDVQPEVLALRDVVFAEGELEEYVRELKLEGVFDEQVLELLRQFELATTFGSLIQPVLDARRVAALRAEVERRDLSGNLFMHSTHERVLLALRQAQVLVGGYSVVVANPPYMGGKTMNQALREYARGTFRDSASDLFAIFMTRMPELTNRGGYSAAIAMHSWMFISSFAAFRQRLFSSTSVANLLHLGARAFDSITGEVVQTCAYVAVNKSDPDFVGAYFDLQEGRSEAEKCQRFLDLLSTNSAGQYRMKMADARMIPGSPLAYWTSDAVRKSFESPETVGEIADPKVGMSSSDNSRFLRLWHEVPFEEIGFGFESAESAASSGLTWFPYNKGGTFRRWYGNNHHVLNWRHDGEDIKRAVVNNPRDPNTTHWSRRIFNTDSFFKPALTWSLVSSSDLSVRSSGTGFLFDVGGSSAFPPPEDAGMILGLLNSELSKVYLKIFNPTLNFQPGNVAAIPADRRALNRIHAEVERLVEQSICVSRADWDNFETSWDFTDHPFLRPNLRAATVATTWANYQTYCNAAIARMQELETENNRLFIAAYGLQDELSPDVPEEQITLARADQRKDAAAFLSYAVGCMMGRYSLDQPGLILADAGDTLENYLAKVGKPLSSLTFAPDDDGILPVLDDNWFADDIVARTREFLRACFGDATLAENLRFVEQALGKDLRKYFLTDFYRDHLQTYKKRPIYWMVQSPKKGFACLVYLHRYSRDSLSLVLNRYLRSYLDKLRNRLAHLAQIRDGGGTSVSDRTNARREYDRLHKVLRECEDWERDTLLPLAQARIALDLDDGVKVNYSKLGAALAPIPGLAAADEE